MIIAIWDSDLALVSVSVFILLYFYFLFRENTFKSVLMKIDLYYLIFGIIIGSIFIFYAKSLSPIRNDYSKIGTLNEILGTLNIFCQSLYDIFLFKKNEIFTSIYSYLALFSVILICVFLKKVKFSDSMTKRLFLFFLLDLTIVFTIIIITEWTYVAGVPQRYFNCTYISAAILTLLLYESLNLNKVKINIIKYILLITVLIGSFGTLYTMRVVWYKPYKPYSEVVSELDKLGNIGIIAEYWNSYTCSVNEPEKIKATPHDKSWVRNWKLVEDVFKQEKIYLIKDMWLDSFPDTITQFGRTLVRQEKPFNLANANLCRYKIINN